MKALAFGLALFAAAAWAQDEKPDPLAMVSGSASMPLKPLVNPVPKKPEGVRVVRPIRFGVWVKTDGSVDRVDILVDNAKWRDESLKVISGWKFEPVLWEGKAIPTRTEVTFSLINGNVGFTMTPVPNFPTEFHTENEFGLKMPVVKFDPDLVMPILERAIRGKLESEFQYLVGRDGLPYDFTVLGVNSESAYRAVINQLANQIYTPGTVANEPVIVRMKQHISVFSNEKPPEALAGLIEAMDPIYPYDQLLAGNRGSAKVRFTLDGEGRVTAAEVLNASHPDFGYALKAAVESWLFSKESSVTKDRVYEHDFTPDSLPGGVTRLISAIRKGEKISSSLEGLDGRPKRAYSPGLSYPPEMYAKKQAGSAQIEFVLDRSGLAQIPRIVEASDPTFGWAAATWIGSMRFRQLNRNGGPVDLRVSVPVVFNPPREGN